MLRYVTLRLAMSCAVYLIMVCEANLCFTVLCCVTLFRHGMLRYVVFRDDLLCFFLEVMSIIGLEARGYGQYEVEQMIRNIIGRSKRIIRSYSWRLS